MTTLSTALIAIGFYCSGFALGWALRYWLYLRTDPRFTVVVSTSRHESGAWTATVDVGGSSYSAAGLDEARAVSNAFDAWKASRGVRAS